MFLFVRHNALIGILGVTFIAGACSAQSAPASEGAADRASTPAPASTSASASASYEGFLEKMSCDMLRGWAWNPSQPDAPLTIELYDGDKLLKTVVADQYRQDLSDAHKGNGKHLFVETPPAELKDGKPHSIRAVVKGTAYALRPLADTPASMTCAK